MTVAKIQVKNYELKEEGKNSHIFRGRKVGSPGIQCLKVEWTESSDTFGKGFPLPPPPHLLLSYLLVHSPFWGLVLLYAPSQATTHLPAICQKLRLQH